MPKAEKGSIKDIGKRIKAKGLQKLKFYCQMCEKQCRDANGFKCHMQSDSHLRQMKIFSENAGHIMDRYSKDFEKMYLDTLRMRHGTATVNANNVYQEVIQDRHHIHQNSTIWASLSDFCKYLGKTGKCVVKETDRGWYVTYIERDAAKQARQEALQARLAAESAAESALSERMERQRVEAAKALAQAGGSLQTETTKLERGDDGETLQVALKQKKKKQKSKKEGKAVKSVFGDDDDDEEEEEGPPPSLPPPPPPKTMSQKRPRPDHVRREESDKKRSKHDDLHQEETWLYPEIVVRIINKKLARGKYFKRKASVDKILNEYTAVVTVLEDSSSGQQHDDDGGGDVLQLDQDDLETVVPKKVGQQVRMVRGKYRGKQAVVLKLDKTKYRAALELPDGTVLKRVDYEDFSKVT